MCRSLGRIVLTAGLLTTGCIQEDLSGDDGSGVAWALLLQTSSSWTAYTLNIGASTTAPTKASAPVYDQASYRLSGDTLQVAYTYRHTSNVGATAGAGVYLFSLPAGFTADSSRVVISTDELTGVVGAAATENAADDAGGFVKVFDNQNLALVVHSDPATINFNFVSGANFPLTDATVTYSFLATVPVIQ